MGKTRTTVGTTVSRAIENSLVPNAIKTAIENSVIKNTEMTEYMVAGLADSLASRCHRMYDYAKNGHYLYGLPKGAFYTPAETGEQEVLSVLRSIEGSNVDIELQYLHYGVPNNLHFGWVQLVNQYGYNTTTNEITGLSATKGSPVYLEDMVVVVPNAAATQVDVASLAQWGVSPKAGETPERPAAGARQGMVDHSPVEVSPTGTDEYLRVTYVWGPKGSMQRETLNIPMVGISDSARFFHAAYLANGVLKYFFYEDGAGVYVLLDMVFDAPPSPNGTFFPFIYFRFNKTSEIFDTSTDSYKAGKKIMRHLGMSYDDVARAINQNPDITDVEQAMLMMAVPANTENKIEQRYLWDFFNALFLTQAPEAQQDERTADLFQQVVRNMSGFTNPGVAIQDGRFKMWLDNEGIYKKRVAGKLGKVGTYKSGFQRSAKTIDAVDPVTGGRIVLESPGGYHYYQKQVSAGFYDEIQVIGLRTVFNIFGEYNSTGDEEDPILLVPLDRAITERYTMPKREELYARSLHYVFNSRITTKIKWYQTEWFRIVLIIIMIVVTFLTNGATAKELAALIAAGSYAAAAYIILIKILETVLIRAIFKILVRTLGADAAMVIAFIAMAMGVADAMDAGSLSGAPFAKELLMLASNMAQGITDFMKTKFSDLAGEYDALEDWKKEQEKVLEAGKDLLGDETRLSPFVIFGETPQEFFNRTVHSGNIGVLSIDAVSKFVDTKLRLPEAQDTIGGFAYE